MNYKQNCRIKNFKVDYNRMDICENRLTEDPLLKADYGVTAIGLNKAQELLAMVCEDIYSDGNYSDFECCVWSALKRVLIAEGKL